MRNSSPRSATVKLDDVQIHIPPGPRLGERVLTATGLARALAIGC